MAGPLSFTRAEAAARPLTPETVAEVIAEARRAVLGQILLAVGVSTALLLVARSTSGLLSTLIAGIGLVSLWGVLATLMAAWDHARTSALLRKQASTEIARESDPAKFWWAHRGLFPIAWPERTWTP